MEEVVALREDQWLLLLYMYDPKMVEACPWDTIDGHTLHSTQQNVYGKDKKAREKITDTDIFHRRN